MDQDPFNDYTDQPSKIRIYSDCHLPGKVYEWFIEGIDKTGRFTEDCWSYDSFEEAVADLKRFVETTARYGIRWNLTAPKQSDRIRA